MITSMRVASASMALSTISSAAEAALAYARADTCADAAAELDDTLPADEAGAI